MDIKFGHKGWFFDLKFLDRENIHDAVRRAFSDGEFVFQDLVSKWVCKSDPHFQMFSIKPSAANFVCKSAPEYVECPDYPSPQSVRLNVQITLGQITYLSRPNLRYSDWSSVLLLPRAISSSPAAAISSPSGSGDLFTLRQRRSLHPPVAAISSPSGGSDGGDLFLLRQRRSLFPPVAVISSPSGGGDGGDLFPLRRRSLEQ
jgi:hypothetical protein